MARRDLALRLTAPFAVDAATGEMLWMHRLEEGRRAEVSSRRLSGRGVGYWTDGKGDERIFRG